MRIIFGINNFDNAGAENFMLRLAKYFSKKGHKIGLFSLCKIESTHLNRLNLIFDNDLSNITLIEPYIPGKIENYFLWKLNGFLMRFGINDYRIKFIQKKTKNAIKRFKPDILNSHLFETDEFFSTGLEFTHVISMHGPYEYYLFKEYNDDGSSYEINLNQNLKLNSTFISKANYVLNSSKNVIYCADKNLGIFNYIEDTGISKEKIYYGFEKKSIETQMNRSTINIGMFSRGVESKGWEFLIKAFLEIEEKYSNVILNLAYTETDYMSNLKVKYAYNKKIHFLGMIDPIEKLMNDIDFIVFPTKYPGESLPNTIIESLFYSKPIISTDIAEIPNMIQYKGFIAGQIISLKGNDDSIFLENLIQSICKYLDNKKLFSDHKSNCLVVASQFEIEQCYQSYLHYFKKAILKN